MDAAIFKEFVLWATAGGGGLFLALKLLQRIGSAVRVAVAADDRSVSLLDRMERQLAEQDARLRSAEDRRLAQARVLERRAAAAAIRAERAGRERDVALAQVDRLAFRVQALCEDLRRPQPARRPRRTHGAVSGRADRARSPARTG